MIFPGVPSFFQVFQVEWEPWFKWAMKRHIGNQQKRPEAYNLPALVFERINKYICLACNTQTPHRSNQLYLK